jgi:hypothetical protein
LKRRSNAGSLRVIRTPLSRRGFLAGSIVLGAATAAAGQEAARFFTVRKRSGHWMLITPEGNPFFSLGLNHIDSSVLRHPEMIHIWREKYGNSTERWLKEAVAPDLRDWGFNTVGWVQDYVTATVRHSPNFTYEEYQWLGLPYCHMLPFAQFHQWERDTRHPDFLSPDFGEWCDYIARAECSRFADDAKLIGYFYSDCPTWVHDRPHNRWRGPVFDPERLKTEAGRQEFSRVATKYYQTTHDAIRRYDPHHLILGDRYEAKALLPIELLLAAKPFIDVLSFQHFGAPAEVKTDLTRFHEQTSLPVLYADGCVAEPLVDGSNRHSPTGYTELLSAVRSIEGCIGLHLCGAYLKNRARRRGLKNEDETPDAEAINAIRAANQDTARWAAQIH